MQKSHTYKFILCLIGILSCVLLFFLTRSVCRTGDEARAESYADIYTYGDSSAEETKIFCQELEGEWYLFLPSGEADTVHLYGTEQGTEDVALSEEQETIYESDFWQASHLTFSEYSIRLLHERRSGGIRTRLYRPGQ